MMSGNLKIFLLSWIFAAMLGGLTCAEAQMSGEYNGIHYDVHGLARTDWALSTSGEPNPNNIGALSTSGNSWNMMAYRLESWVKLDVDDGKAANLGLDHVSALIHPRFYADLGPEVDGNLKNVNLFGGLPGGNYPGNGWMVETIDINEWMLDLPEAYVDLAKAGFNLRLGKQRIVWSPMIFVRVLDTVDGLDYRRHSLWGPVHEGLEDQRIGQWTANLTYQIPQFYKHLTKSSLQAFISPDFEPTVYPAQGSAYSMFSSGFVFNDAASIATARHKIVYGAAWFGTLFDIDVSLNFVSTPQINGVTQYALATGTNAVPNTPYILDVNGFKNNKQWSDAALRNKIIGIDNGTLRTNIDSIFPRVPAPYNANPFAGGPIDIAATNVYPRAYVFGGSIQRAFKYVGTGRLEVTYTPNKEFRWLWRPDTVNAGELAIGGMFRREFNWAVEKLSPTIFELEYWYKSRSDFFDRYASSYEERDLPFSVYMIEQPLMGQELLFDGSVMLDASQGGGGWIQPGVRYQPGKNWAYEAFYNFFWGGQRDQFGAFSSFDEIFMRVSYRF
jgi:Protein of unknown function (DUF1302)